MVMDMSNTATTTNYLVQAKQATGKWTNATQAINLDWANQLAADFRKSGLEFRVVAA